MCFSFLFWPNKQGLRINLFLALGHRIWHVASLFGADCLREGWPYYLCLSRHKGLHIISTSTEMTYPHIHTLHPYCKKKCTCILRSAFDIFFPSIPYILQIPMAPMARRSCPWTSGATGQADHRLVSPRWGRSCAIGQGRGWGWSLDVPNVIHNWISIHFPWWSMMFHCHVGSKMIELIEHLFLSLSRTPTLRAQINACIMTP